MRNVRPDLELFRVWIPGQDGLIQFPSSPNVMEMFGECFCGERD